MKAFALICIFYISTTVAAPVYARAQNLFEQPISQVGPVNYVKNEFAEGNAEVHEAVSNFTGCAPGNHCNGVFDGLAFLGLSAAAMAVGAAVGGIAVPVGVVGGLVIFGLGETHSYDVAYPDHARWEASPALQAQEVPVFGSTQYHEVLNAIDNDARIISSWRGPKAIIAPAAGEAPADPAASTATFPSS